MAITTEPAAAQGPSIAFDDFYSDMWPHAFRLAAFLTHDTQAGEDVAQEVLAAMSQRWGLVERPEAYLQRAITNASWKWIRQARTATRKLPLLAAHSGDEFRFDELADAIARLQHLPPGPHEQGGRLLEALARLEYFSREQWSPL